MLEAGGLRLEPATVDVVDVARAAVEAARIRTAGTEVTLRAVAESSTIETDAGRLNLFFQRFGMPATITD